MKNKIKNQKRTSKIIHKLAGALHIPGMKYVPIEIARRKAGIVLATFDRKLQKLSHGGI